MDQRVTDPSQPSGIPYTRTLALTGVSERIADRNPQRVRFLIQNQGPGNVWWSPVQQGRNQLEGILLRDGGVMIDTSLFSQGEVWVVADQNETKVAFAGWTDV